MELARAFVSSNGVIAPEGSYHCFIDWNKALDKQAAMHGIWLYSLRQGIRLCSLIGDAQTGSDLTQEYLNGNQAALEHLWDSGKQLFISGPARQISWASQIWMCLAGVVTGPDAARILSRASSETGITEMVTPFLFHHYVQALIECEKAEIAFEEIKRYWGGMIKSGADTFWELYNPNNAHESPYGSGMINSFCHAWSCTPAYFLR